MCTYTFEQCTWGKVQIPKVHAMKRRLEMYERLRLYIQE